MKSILIIDDAEFILESTSALLKYEGYNIITAENGLLGVEAALSHKPDLILCDISMPELDGFGVLERIRSESETKRIPFIFLTAFADKSSLRSGMEKGADDYLIKPFTKDELIAALDAQWKKYSIVEEELEVKVNQFSKNIATSLPHEFRTVLNQISGTAKYLNANYNNINHDELFELSQDIVSSSTRLLKITENYLIYTRMESFITSKTKRQMLRTYKTDEPAAIILDYAYLIAQKYNRTDDLELNGIAENIYVEVSTESFHKIIDELLDNAFKFSTKGTKIIICVDKLDDYLEITIEDHGRGMTQEQITSVGALVQFERNLYEQQGVGLGLIISKRLVELHDGVFEIESKFGHGTKIKFSLPCKNIQ